MKKITHVYSRFLVLILLMTLLALGLTACGGGGGGGGGDVDGGGDTTTPPPPPPTPVVHAGKVFVGGTAGINQLSSLVASASLGKASGDLPVILADAKVILKVIRKDGSIHTTATRTNARGAYSVEIDAKSGDTVTITIEKTGFSPHIKTFTLTDQDFPAEGDRRQLTVSGNLTQAAIISSTRANDVFKAGGGQGNGFRFGLMRAGSGVRSAFASGDELRRAAYQEDGSTPELDISIPGSWAPDATTLTSMIAAFDPSNADQRGSFPGQFVGIGGGTAAGASRANTDQRAYQLESISFFSAEVTPNSGQLTTPADLVASGASAEKANAAGQAVIYKYIPDNGCGAMKKYEDRDGGKDGIQVPIYTFNPNDGQWGYLGEGTLVIYNYDTGIYDTVPVNDLNMDGIDDSEKKGLTGLACGQKEYYFAIETNDWYTWWNLDYPILMEEPKVYCLQGKVTDSDGNPVPGAFVEANGYGTGGSSYFDAYSGNDGSFSIDIVPADNETLNNYVFTAYNYSQWPATSLDFSTAARSANSTTSCNNIGNIKIPDRLACTITGKLLEKNGNMETPLAQSWISAENSSYSYYNWAWTNADGSFTMKATCNDPITVWAWGDAFAVNIDNRPAGFEQSDNGKIVTLKNQVKINAPPQVEGWITPNPARVGEDILFESWAWDAEDDTPLTYQWSISGSNTIYNSPSAIWTPLTAGDYTVTLTVKDKMNNATARTFPLEVSAAPNNAPVILYAWAQRGEACNAPPTFFVHTYDPDGDPLQFTWSQGSPYSRSGGGYVPQAAVSGTIDLTVSDGKEGGTVTTSMQVPAASAGVQLHYAEAWPLNPSSGEAVTLYAYADQEGAPISSYIWTVMDPDGIAVDVVPTLGDTSSVTFTPAKGGDYQVQVMVNGACGTEDVAQKAFKLTASAPNLVQSQMTITLESGVTVGSLDFIITLPSGFTLPVDASGQPLTSALEILATSTVSALKYTPETETTAGQLRVGMVRSSGFGANVNLLTISRTGTNPPDQNDFQVILNEAGDLSGGILTTGVALNWAVRNTDAQ